MNAAQSTKFQLRILLAANSQIWQRMWQIRSVPRKQIVKLGMNPIACISLGEKINSPRSRQRTYDMLQQALLVLTSTSPAMSKGDVFFYQAREETLQLRILKEEECT